MFNKKTGESSFGLSTIQNQSTRSHLEFSE